MEEKKGEKKTRFSLPVDRPMAVFAVKANEAFSSLSHLQMSHLLPAALPVLDGLGEIDLRGEQVALARGGGDGASRRGIQNQRLHALGAAGPSDASSAAAAAKGAINVGAHDGDEVQRRREALRTSLGRIRGHRLL